MKNLNDTSSLSGSYDTIVIGSGMGGLATAALLAKTGEKVLVLERHYVAGGFTHTFSRKGYEWDVGLHYIGEVHRKNSVLRRIFDDVTDGALQWSLMSPVYDKIFIAEQTYEFHSGVKAFREHLCAAFPGEQQAIDDYISLVFKATRTVNRFFSEKSFPPAVGYLASPFLRSSFLNFSDQTTLQVLSRLTANRKLIGVLTAQYGDYGLPPSQSSFAIHAMIVKHYFDGGNYPVGGSGRIAETVIPVIEKAGGKILLRADVSEILVEGNKAIGVRLANGNEIKAKKVVSDAGVINTFKRLLPEKISSQFHLEKKLLKVNPSLAHVCLYVGCRQSVAALGLGQSNYWIYPDYDHDENIRRYVANPKGAPLPLTYISFPSTKDPTWEKRFPGRSTIEIIGYALYDWFKKWEDKPWMKRGDDYHAAKEEFSQRLLQQLYRFVPQVEGKVDHYELSTPLSTQHFCNYKNGEIYGLDHTPERFRLRWLRPHTPVKNLFLTGQDIVSAGVTGALFAGVLTASAILRRNIIKDVLARTS